MNLAKSNNQMSSIHHLAEIVAGIQRTRSPERPEQETTDTNASQSSQPDLDMDRQSNRSVTVQVVNETSLGRAFVEQFDESTVL